MASARPLTLPGVQYAALTATLLIAQQVAGKATRDALFLSSFRAVHLPAVMAAGALLSLAVAYGASHVMARHGPARILPLLFAASACGFTLAWTVNLTTPRTAAILVYLQTALFAPVTISTFWSLINERFDPHTGKRAVARIAGGGTLGGLLGGLAAWRASSPGAVLLLLAALNALAVVGTLMTRGRGHAQAATSSSATAVVAAGTISPFKVLRGAPLLRNLALLVALGAATSALLDYIFSVQAAAAFAKGQPLLGFFSIFWMVVGVVSFLLQISLGRVILERLGVTLTLAILPGVILLGGAFGLGAPGLASASLLRGAEAVQNNTLFRSAYELLYTPVPEEQKRATKALIDVAFDRFGTVVGSGIALLVLHSFSRSEPTILLAAVVALGLLMLPVVRRLHQEYILALQQGLRDGAKKLQLGVEDNAFERTSGLPGQLTRDELIERIEVIQPGGLTALIDPTTEPRAPAPKPGRAFDALKNPKALVAGLGDMFSANSERVERALANLDNRGPAVACAILLLAHQQHHKRALQALRAHAATITGQLIDALLDPTMDFVVRRRVPRVLNRCVTRRAVDGLLLGLADERFEVRYECGRALLQLSAGSAQPLISREQALETIRRELDNGSRMTEGMKAQFEDDPSEDDHSLLIDGLVRERVTRGLEHVFTILALHLEREPLRMAFRALYHDDTTYRGTALEYLDTVLPSEIREIIWPHLGAAATPLPTARSPGDLLADLARADPGT